MQLADKILVNATSFIFWTHILVPNTFLPSKNNLSHHLTFLICIFSILVKLENTSEHEEWQEK